MSVPCSPVQPPGSPLPLGSPEDKLRVAASKGLGDRVHELLQAGARLEPDREGRTALHYAALNGYGDVCKQLMPYMGNKDATDVLGYTPLHRAASQGHAEVIEILVEGGSTVNLPDKNGNTPLHEAAWNGFSKSLEMLVKHNSDVTIANKGGFTALHLTAQNGHNESTRVLLYASCSSDLKNNYGDTALHTAARYGHAGVTRILVSARCRLNEQNKNGDTSLHIAAALKRRKIAKLLVEAGIDSNITNKQNETAIDVARRKEHPEIIIIIQSFARPKTPKSPRPPSRAHPNVTFKDEIQVDIEGPVVVPDEEVPVKPEKPEKERRFFFFKKKKKDKDKDKEKDKVQANSTATPPGGQQSGPAKPWEKPVQGFFSQYVPRGGVQYYRDLAGNVKQGPVGYTPMCQCGPNLKKLEDTVQRNKDNMVDHVNASHQLLKGQIDQLDRRTAQQVYSIDRLTKERLENEHNMCHGRITERLRSQRQDTEKMFNEYNEQIQTWLDSKLASYGHCLSHHHDDSALPPRNIFSDFHENENGRLFRSRSDETLSQSDYSGKHRKKDFYESRQEAMQHIRAWQLPSYRTSVRRKERNNNNVTVTKAEIHGPMDRRADGASPKWEGSPTRPMHGHPNFVSPGVTSPVDVSAIKRETGNQGAIPKKLPHSHSWQHAGSHSKPGHSRSREVSPQVNGIARMGEGNHQDVRLSTRPMVQSQTDPGNLNRHSSMPKQNLPERGPPNVRNKPGAPEVPPKPPKPGIGSVVPQNVNHQNSAYATVGTGFYNQNPRTSQVYQYQDETVKFRPRTRSTDTLLADDNVTFRQQVTRSKSVDRTLNESDRNDGSRGMGGGGVVGSVLDRNMNLENNVNMTGTQRQSGFQVLPPRSPHGVPYRVPPATSNPSQPSNRNSVYRESPYASAKEMQWIANSMAVSPSPRLTSFNANPAPSPRPGYRMNPSPSPKPGFNMNSSPSPKPGFSVTPSPSPKPGFSVNPSPLPHSGFSVNSTPKPGFNVNPSPRTSGFQAYDNSNRNNESGRNRDYADISQFRKEHQPYRSMHGIQGDMDHHGNYESVPLRNSMSKSENNLTKNDSALVSGEEKTRPSKPPPYGYRYSNSGANSAGNQGYSANTNGIPPANNIYHSGNYSHPVNSPNNNAPPRTGSVTPISGHYGGSKTNENNNTVSNHGNYLGNHSNNTQDSYNMTQSGCLRHESPYPRTSVYNPAYSHQNNKEDSTCSSNQDSGYSSKAKLPYMGQSPDGMKSNSGTPSSSFSMDRSLSTGTPSQNNSPFVTPSQNSPFLQTSSPFTPVMATSSPFSPPKESSTPAFSYTNGSDYEKVHQSPRQPVNIQSHVNGWYQKKLLEAADKLRKSEQYSGPHNYSTAPINYDPVNGSDV